jgi:hypothetical protein
MGEPPLPQSTKPNVTFTALIWLGMFLALAGAAVAVFGIGAPTSFDAKLGDGEVSTTNLGLAIMVVGAIMAAYVATKLPKGVVPFAVRKVTWQDRFADKSAWLVAFAVLACLLLCFSIWKS